MYLYMYIYMFDIIKFKVINVLLQIDVIVTILTVMSGEKPKIITYNVKETSSFWLVL